MGRDANIYGADDIGYARGIFTDALNPAANGDWEDIWGGVEQDNFRAQAKSNVGDESTGPSDPKTPVTRGQGAGNTADAEKLDFSADWNGRARGSNQRHRPGPKGEAEYAGYESKFVPKNQTATRRGGGPRT